MRYVKMTAFCSLCAGLLLNILGLALVGFYIFTVVSSLQQVDRSLIFWYSGFLFFGLIFIMSGIYYLILGVLLLKNQTQFYRLTRYSLFIFIILIILCSIRGYIVNTEIRNDERKKNELQNDVNGQHKLDNVSVKFQPEVGLLIHISTTDGTSGQYELMTSVTYDNKSFYYMKKNVHFDTTSQQFESRISLQELFDQCKQNPSYAYICIDNAGTSNSRFKVHVTLHSSPVERNTMYQEVSEESLNSKEVYFTVDTVQRNGDIQLSNFKLVSSTP